MSSRTARPPAKRTQPEPEDDYPHIRQPNQGHAGHFLAIASVIAILGFGVWSAYGTLTGTGAKSASPPTPVATPKTATPLPNLVPTAPPPAAGATQLPGPGASATAATGAAKVHVVASGDTLYGIALKYKTTVEAIMASNNFTDRNRVLHVGDKLTIP